MPRDLVQTFGRADSAAAPEARGPSLRRATGSKGLDRRAVTPSMERSRTAGTGAVRACYPESDFELRGRVIRAVFRSDVHSMYLVTGGGSFDNRQRPMSGECRRCCHRDWPQGGAFRQTY